MGKKMMIFGNVWFSPNFSKIIVILIRKNNKTKVLACIKVFMMFLVHNYV